MASAMLGERRKSAEFFVPEFAATRREASMGSAVFALVSTVVGGGSLTLSYAIRQLGVGVGLGLLVVIAFASDLGASLLVSCSRRSGGSTYEDVAKRAFGRAAQIGTVVLLFVLTYLCCAAYIILVGDLSVPLVEQYMTKYSFHNLGRSLSMGGALLLVTPLCFLRNLHALRFTSALSMVTITYLAVVMLVRMVQHNQDHPGQISRDTKYTTSLSDTLYGFPLVSVAFLCHFNVLPVHTELTRPTKARIRGVIHWTMVCCVVLYSLMALVGYFTFFEDTNGDILNNFHKTDNLVNSGRLGLLITVLFSFPLLALPCRDSLDRLVLMTMQCLSASPQVAPAGDAESPADDVLRTVDSTFTSTGATEKTALLDKKYLSQVEVINGGDDVAPSDDDAAADLLSAGDMTRRSLEMVAVIVSSFFIAVFVPSVAVVWSFMGSTVSIFIAYILPAAFYLKIRRHKQLNFRKVCAWLLLFSGIIATVVCTYQSVMTNIVDKHKH